jgi:protein TonB
LRTAAQVGARSAEVAAVRAELVSAQTSQKAAEVARVRQLLEERVGQGQLLTPANDSAYAYLEALERLDTGGPVYRTAQTSLANALLTQARGELQRGDLAATERNLNAARDVGVDALELAAVSNELAETRERERLANSVVGVGTLKRTRYVEPVYPDGAREKNVTGWVDLEFVVMRNGGVAEVRVTGASPAGVFDAAAAAALARWRFAPVLRAGEPVEQRARLRMRFSLE